MGPRPFDFTILWRETPWWRIDIGWGGLIHAGPRPLAHRCGAYQADRYLAGFRTSAFAAAKGLKLETHPGSRCATALLLGALSHNGTEFGITAESGPKTGGIYKY